MTRNDKILKIIKAGEVPVLPFELDVAQNQLEEYKNEQDALGEDLGNAMRQSSETWHDNAPAEALSYASKILTERAKALLSLIDNAVVFDLPAKHSNEVTLGSLVGVLVDGDAQITVGLVGAIRELPIDIQRGVENLAGFQVATISSPMGAALLGLKLHQSGSFLTPQGSKKQIVITSIGAICE